MTSLERLTGTDEAIGNRRYSPDVTMHRMEEVSPWVDIFQLAQLLIWMLKVPSTDAWDRPLDWRYVSYDKRLPSALLAAIHGVTAKCCEESLSPRDGGELATFLRQRIPSRIHETMRSTSIDIEKIREAKTLGQSLQDIAVAEDTRAVQAAATAIAPVCVEIIGGLHGLVTSAAELGLKVTPGSRKDAAEIIDIAMARLRRHGIGMYNATFQGTHGHLAIYCNLEVELPSSRRKRGLQNQGEPEVSAIVFIQCTRVTESLAGATARVECQIKLKSDGTLILQGGADRQIGSVSIQNVIEMFKDWIEDPKAWAAMERDR
ncbi:hypothetical protein K2Y11_14380 [bacterium]|nr:hypothetical protein [bacterium]